MLPLMDLLQAFSLHGKFSLQSTARPAFLPPHHHHAGYLLFCLLVTTCQKRSLSCQTTDLARHFENTKEIRKLSRTACACCLIILYTVRPGSRSIQVDLGRLGPPKSGQVSFYWHHRQIHWAQSDLSQVDLGTKFKQTAYF